MLRDLRSRRPSVSPSLIPNPKRLVPNSKRPLPTVYPRQTEEAVVLQREPGSRPRSVRLTRRRTSLARREAHDVGRRSTTTPRVGVLCSRMDAMRTTCLVSRQVAGRSTVRRHRGAREGRGKNEPVCVRCVRAVGSTLCCRRRGGERKGRKEGGREDCWRKIGREGPRRRREDL